ncbi:TrbI F-type domain-containing protein [Asticcacaulis biprosthecium]|uniref:TrbI F-type domain-containing protein n=1 Tax=Asticcacaulis biprosthecium TaxID=76891 RepID=UPI00032000C8|nr:TrbI F-type domain-containing protein [Asticcacaulis biprosthecium]
MADFHDSPVVPPRLADRAKARFRLKVSLGEAGVCLLVVNLFVMAGLFWKIEVNKPPVIATVSVTQLSRIYGQQFAADPSNTPEMIQLKTRIFLATTEKLLAQSAKQKGMVVFARECVLTGDSLDLTPQVSGAVDQALKSGALSMGGTGNAALNLAQ